MLIDENTYNDMNSELERLVDVGYLKKYTYTDSSLCFKVKLKNSNGVLSLVLMNTSIRIGINFYYFDTRRTQDLTFEEFFERAPRKLKKELVYNLDLWRGL